MEGYVYVLSNAAMPGLVKVGVTERTPETRAAEMSAHEGLPVPMLLEYYAFVEGSVYEFEKRAHRHLHPHHMSKEWFRCPPEEAVAAVRLVVAKALKREKFVRAERIEAERRYKEKALELEKSSAEEHAKERARIQLAKRRDAAIQVLTAEFLRLEPISRKLFFRSTLSSTLIEIINPVSMVAGKFESKSQERYESSQQKHAESFTTEELKTMIRYQSAYRLLTSENHRPKKQSALDRMWRGDYFNVPEYVRTEFEKRTFLRRKIQSKLDECYFPEESACLREARNAGI